MTFRRVVVTGFGVVSCFGADPFLFYEKLLQGQSGVHLQRYLQEKGLNTQFAAPVVDGEIEKYVPAKFVKRYDAYISYALVAGKKAASMAKIEESSPEDLSRCGVIVGSGMGGMQVFANASAHINRADYHKVSPFFVPFTIVNTASALLAIDLGFVGPNYSVSTACATSNYAIYQAANYIKQGRADLMLCGGSEAAANEYGIAGFSALKALSTRNDDATSASRPFDLSRDGFVLGEGAGVLVLESEESALRRGVPILAEYLGGEISNDAFHMTQPHPEGAQVVACIEKALAGANLSKERVNYINAHATATPVGDIAEIKALIQVFGDRLQKIPVNATKSMIGHALGAAGGLEAVVTILAMNRKVLHATKNLENPEPLCEKMFIPTSPLEWEIDVALSNAVGFGGHNSALLFAPYYR